MLWVSEMSRRRKQKNLCDKQAQSCALTSQDSFLAASTTRFGSINGVRKRAHQRIFVPEFLSPRSFPFFNCPPRSRRFTNEPCLLRGVHSIPDQTLKSLNFCFPLGYPASYLAHCRSNAQDAR